MGFIIMFLFGLVCFLLVQGIRLIVINWDKIQSWFPIIDALDGLISNIGEGDSKKTIYVFLMMGIVLVTLVLLYFGAKLTTDELLYGGPIILNCITGILWTVGINFLDQSTVISIVVLSLGSITAFLSLVFYADKTGIAKGFWGTLMFQVGLVLLPSALYYFICFVIVAVMIGILVAIGKPFFSGIGAAIDSGQDVVGDIQRMRADMVADNSRHREAQPDRRDEVFENVRRTTGASPYDIKVNRDGSKFNVGGEWHSVSKDGSSYETSGGSWENFRP